MPFVKISALPGRALDIRKITSAVERNLYDNDILPKGSATVLWQTLDCITHTLGSTGVQESLREFDPGKKEFPVFIDLYLTSVFGYDEVKNIMASIASSVGDAAGMNPEYVFVHTHVGEPGYVYINNEVWPSCEITHPGA